MTTGSRPRHAPPGRPAEPWGCRLIAHLIRAHLRCAHAVGESKCRPFFHVVIVPLLLTQNYPISHSAGQSGATAEPAGKPSRAWRALLVHAIENKTGVDEPAACCAVLCCVPLGLLCFVSVCRMGPLTNVYTESFRIKRTGRHGRGQVAIRQDRHENKRDPNTKAERAINIYDRIPR